MLRSELCGRALALTVFSCAALAACTSDSPNDSGTPIGGAAGAAGASGGAGGSAGTAGAGGSAGIAGAGGIGGNAGNAGAGMAGAAGTMAGTGGGGGSGGAGGTSDPGDAAMPDASADEGVSSETGVIVPTAEWACDRPGGIPAPEDGTLVAEIEIDLQAPLELGATQFGERTILLTESGSVTGEIEGSVIKGGYDWELTLPSGARELETRHVLRTSSGTLIYMRGCGVGTPSGATRMIMEVEVGSSFAAFQSGIHVATRELTDGHARFALYRFAEGFTPDAATTFTIERTTADRALKPHPWQCLPPPAGSSEGPQIIEATVGIGSSLAVGATQNGSRNIIPITGGTFEGMGTSSGLDGDVVPGGADFQITPPGESFQLEARYTLKAQDGTLIAVRNCGGVGGTAPYFEAPLASPYAYLNDGDYFGRIGISIGAVIISVFERMP